MKESVIVNFGDSGWGAVGMSLTGKLPFKLYNEVCDLIETSEVLLADNESLYYTSCSGTP